jgi:hypothetical protein
MNNYLTKQKYNTVDFEGCNNVDKVTISNKLTPEYLINNGWNESGIAGKWYVKSVWHRIYTFAKSYPHIGVIYFKYSFDSEQIMIANVDDMNPSFGKNCKWEFEIIRTIDDLKRVMEMEFICEKLKL